MHAKFQPGKYTITPWDYTQDESHGVGFLLSAVLYVNTDSVLNDDKYEYDRIGFPFLRDLGRRVYEAERRRARR